MATVHKQAFNLRSFAAAPGAPTVTPTGGAAGAYSYKAVAVAEADGTGYTAASTAGTTSAGPTTLDLTHYNTLTSLAVPPGFDHVDVYRTAGGATQGKIATITGATTSLVDNGLAGDGATPPAAAAANLGTSDALPVNSYERFSVWLRGLTGTWKLQFSADAGTTWEDSSVVSHSSAAHEDVSTMLADLVRIVILTQSAGSPTADLRGLYAHEGG